MNTQAEHGKGHDKAVTIIVDGTPHEWDEASPSLHWRLSVPTAREMKCGSSDRLICVSARDS